MVEQMETQPAVPVEAMDGKQFSLKFKIGIFFFILSFPFGYGGAALGAIMAAYSEHRAFWLSFGVVTYALSWGMIGLTAILSGKEGLDLAREWTRKIWKRKSVAPPVNPAKSEENPADR